MELRKVFCHSIKILLLCQILSLFIQKAESQLDLPGPPYPDKNGENRWGVKFDPRKHGPPLDLSGGSSHRSTFRRPPRPRFQRRHPRLQRSRRQRQRHRPNPFYGNDLKKPQSHSDYYNRNPKSPITLEEQKFWNTWNSWSKKQAKHKELKELTKIKKEKDPETSTPLTIYINMDDFKSAQISSNNYADNHEDSDKHKKAKDGLDGRWKKSRDYYMQKMNQMYSRAKSLVTFESSGDGQEDYSDSNKKGEGSWEVFTTIGKGLDAANGAMRGLRKAVGGSVISTGMKYGKKMAVDAVMNVGTSAIVTAIKTSAFG